jgi:hypothetical protein
MARFRPASKVAASSSNTNLVPNTAANITFEGAGAERVVIITPASNTLGTATITLTVSDSPAAKTTVLTSTGFDLGQRPAVGWRGHGASLGWRQRCRVREANVLPFKGSFTVEAWVSAPTNAAPAEREPSSARALAATPLRWASPRRAASAWAQLGDGGAVPLGAWHHLAVVRDSTNTQLL